MIKGNNGNMAPFLDDLYQYSADVPNQPQLCGNLSVEFHPNPVNYLGNNHGPPFLQPNKCGRDAEAIPNLQKLHFSSSNKVCHDKAERKASIMNQIHPVSTGLRLSYDDDERNSSITSGSRSMIAATSVFSSLRNDIRRGLDQQKEQLDCFIRTQEAALVKGVRDIQQSHMASLLTALEKGAAKKLYEKDLELDTITCKNKELVESMKQVTAEAQNWCYMAKYNESLVNVLKTNLQQAMMQGSNQEGFGESDADDAASCIDPNNHLRSIAGGSSSVKKDMICRACKAKQASILLMPCRHLCLCKECERFVSVCPVCQMITSASFEVYLS